MPVEERVAERQLVDIVVGAWAAQAVYAAAVLRLPDHVAAGCGDVDELAAAAGASPDGVRRLMRLMERMGIFERGGDGRWRPTALSELLRADAPGSMRDLCLIYGEEFYRAWGAAPAAIRESRPVFDDVFGSPLGAYLGRDPEASARFQRAMDAGSSFFAAVPRAFDFSGCGTIVDVAGGGGLLMAMVLAANPAARGVLMDLPHVVGLARERARTTPALARCDIVEGDLFESIPAGGDVYLLSRVLQDWDDDRCARLLANCRQAMSGAARLLILERVIPEDASATLPLLWDLHLLMVTGGRERTMAEYRSLIEGAGLALESVVSLPLEVSMITARVP